MRICPPLRFPTTAFDPAQATVVPPENPGLVPAFTGVLGVVKSTKDTLALFGPPTTTTSKGMTVNGTALPGRAFVVTCAVVAPEAAADGTANVSEVAEQFVGVPLAPPTAIELLEQVGSKNVP